MSRRPDDFAARNDAPGVEIIRAATRDVTASIVTSRVKKRGRTPRARVLLLDVVLENEEEEEKKKGIEGKRK